MNRRLDSWKAIAAYLERDVTTVRRWEKRERLPVHRHVHDKLGSVYAYSDEIDEWSTRRRLVSQPADPGADSGLAASELQSSPSQQVTKPTAATLRARFRWSALAVALLLAAVAGRALLMHEVSDVTMSRAPLDVAIVPPERVTVTSLSLAPKGDQVVISGFRPGESPRLWVRRLESVSTTELAGTEGATFPFWSPEGNRLGFFADHKLKIISLSTREVRELATAEDGRGGTWSEADLILFAPDVDGPISRISASGGATTPVTTLHGQPAFGHAWPEFLPGGRHFVYLDMTDFGRHGLYVADLDSGPIRRLVRVYSSAAFTADGYLLFAKDKLFAQKLDLKTLTLSGEPIAVADQVLTHFGWNHKMDVSTSRTGMLVVRRGLDGDNRLVWVARSGRELGTLTDAIAYSNPAISPDGTRALVTVYTSRDGPAANLWQVDLQSLQASQLTFSSRSDLAPLWSADGARVMFVSTQKGRPALFDRAALAGGDEVQLPWSLPQSKSITVPESWSRDGRFVTLSSIHAVTKDDVWVFDRQSDRPPRPLLQSGANETQSQISPDGRFIAYASDESGRFEIYVQRFPELGQKWQVSRTGGADPRWRPDGRELFYIGLNRTLMVADVSPGMPARYGTPRGLFATGIKYLWQDTRNHYDVAPDGQRFLILAPKTGAESGTFAMVLNWQQALR